MDIKQYLDSTYLKTAEQAGLSEEENTEVVKAMVSEAIAERFKLVMVRPDMVALAKLMVGEARSKVLVGTVIDFPEGRKPTAAKLVEAEKAVADGADDLDFVIDYNSFKAGNTAEVKQQVMACTQLGRKYGKTVKWIIETAALNEHEIVQLSALVKNCVITHLCEDDYNHVFVKSSTGFYKTENDKSNGATMGAIKLMLENAFPLPVKASGGVRSYDEAVQMVQLGVKRIGTSSAKAIAAGEMTAGGY